MTTNRNPDSLPLPLRTPDNAMEALVGALVCALTAPTDEIAERAAELAEAFAAYMTHDEVESAKAQALTIADDWYAGLR